MAEENQNNETAKPKYSSEVRKRYEPVRSVVKNAVSEGVKKNPDADIKSLRKTAFIAADAIRTTAQEQEERLHQQAITDELTQIPNRRGFEEALAEEVTYLRSTGGTAMLIFLDVNGLKEINDKQGHEVGDQKIVSTAQALAEGSRSSDTRNRDLIAKIARSGGDEFWVLLTNTDERGTRSWWNRQNEIFIKEGIQVSAGAVRLNLDEPNESKKLADRAMYKAKESKEDSLNHYAELQKDGTYVIDPPVRK